MVGIAVAADDDLGVLPRMPTSSTPTSWMSSQARTQRVQRIQVLMSCWITRRRDARRRCERKLVVVADRDVVLGDVALELVAGPGAPPFCRCSAG